MKNTLKIISLVTALFFILVFASIVIVGCVVGNYAKDRVYDSVDNIPYNEVGLVLGASKYVGNGLVNLYYKNRINATVKLYNANKINFILVSGDNSRANYDEPTAMKEDLVSAGIPPEKIFLDFAGFRTLDSVVRSKEIFGQKSITIISQKFHNERAIYIAQHYGINAIGFNAQDIDINYGFKTQVRERFARVKMMLDLLFGKSPKFLGEKIKIE